MSPLLETESAAPAPQVQAPAAPTSSAPPAAGAVQSGPQADPLRDALGRGDAIEGGYAGAVMPPEAWQLHRAGLARLIDVRTDAEVHYVGRVPDALHIEWHGIGRPQVEAFIAALRMHVDPETPALFLCRSGVRSHHAATAAARAGYRLAFNVLEGFEGQRDHAQQRGHIDGWRKHGLPWIQD